MEGALAALTASERAGGAEDWDHLQLAQRLAEAQGDLTRSDALLDRLIDKGVAWPPARIHLELKRAVRRQSRGDVEGAIEDLLRVEGAFSSSASVGLRVRIAELWRQVGQEGRYRESTDTLLAETARTGSEDAWQDLLAAVASVRDVPLEGRATKAAVEADPDADWAKAHRILYLVQPYEDPRELASWTSPDLRYREALRLIDDLEAPPRAPSSKQRGSLLCWRVTALQRLDQAREALAALAGPDGENLEEKVRMTLRGTLLVQTGDVSEGISVLETARAKFPRDHSVVCTLCWNYQAVHRYADAARTAGEAILTDPGCLLCREVLAEASMRQGDLPGALRATEEGLAISSTCVRLLAVRGEVLDMLDLHRESADTLSRLLTTPAAWPPLVYLSQAENLTWLGKFPEAHALLQRWRADMPDDPAADRQEAVTDTAEGHWEHALDVIGRARAAHPDLDASWDGLELTVLRALDREEDARALAKRILASPTGRDPASLVFAEIALGHVDVARGMLVAESPPDAPAPELDAYDAACARALLGDDESAIELLEKAAAAGWVWPPYWAPDPDLERVWNDPRFVRLRREHSQVR